MQTTQQKRPYVRGLVAAAAVIAVAGLYRTARAAPAASDEFDADADFSHWVRVEGGAKEALLEPRRDEDQQSQGGQDRFLWERLFAKDDPKEDGFFVEFGARGGVYDSNTYFFEKQKRWHGLLLEAVPGEQKTIGTDRPRAAALDGGVCETDSKVRFGAAEKGWSGRLDQYDSKRARVAGLTAATFEAACFTLATLCDLFGVRRIDYMSVDTEGSELLALRGFPWATVDVGVVGVEVVTGNAERAAKQAELYAYMASVGYAVFAEYKFAKDTMDVFFAPAEARKTRRSNDMARFAEMRTICKRLQRCL